MSKSDLRKKAEIAPNTMTKLRRDEEVSLTILSKICKTLHADFGDIVEYVPDAEIWDLYNENRELLGKDHVRGEQLPIDGYHWWCMYGFEILRESTLSRSVPQTGRHTL